MIEENKNTNENTKPKNDTSVVISYLLINFAIISFFSSIYYFTSNTDDKWFTRMFFSFVCLGFVGVISAIRENKNI
jgi:ATP-dependent Zn protease